MTLEIEIELISIPKEVYAQFLAQQKGAASSFASTLASKLAQSGSPSYCILFYTSDPWVIGV